MGIGIKLENLLEEHGLTVAELSRLSGVPQTTIYSVIQRNSKKIDINALIEISRHLGVVPEYFADDEPQIRQPQACPSADACQGAAHEAVQMLLRLDRDDLLIIQGELRAMLRAEKYQGEKANEAPA